MNIHIINQAKVPDPRYCLFCLEICLNLLGECLFCAKLIFGLMGIKIKFRTRGN